MSDLLERTKQIQTQVGDPARSAWVSANAGTGKTYVLVRRVIRQLLAGASPESVVCITFTKAAASEMSTRLLGMLSEWALLDDEKLSARVEEVTAERPDPAALKHARKLFAKALESPGGLKIQTIHSFCGSILGRFPAEAGLTLGFRALEEDEAGHLLREAVRDVAAQASDPAHPLHPHLRAVSERFEGEQEGTQRFDNSLEDVLRTFSQKTRALRALDLGTDGMLFAALRETIGVPEGCTAESLTAEFWDGLDLGFLREICSWKGEGGSTLDKLIAGIEAFLDDRGERPELEDAFVFKKDGDPRSHKRVYTLLTQNEERWTGLCDYFVRFREKFRALKIYEANEHFYYLALSCLTFYELRKRACGGLDYEDLIEETLSLLQRTSGSWVRFKLDQGINHVLLDEAQDTSGPSWALFRALVEEIASTDAEAAGVESRSLFVVGDPKQSIYAFTGAQAALFTETHEAYKEQLRDRLVSRSLFLSFRTAQPVLDFVDAVFDKDEFRRVSGDYQPHKSFHSNRPGSVEIWPAIPAPEKPEVTIWDAPVDQLAEDSVDRKAALAIADDIRRRLDEGERLACRDGAPTAPGEVMVLFQRRSARFREVLRALAERGVPCAGTDRIDVAQDVAVRDLIALLRFAANTDDSLSLAVLLRSPFFGWSEDELYELAAEREQEVLWRELKACAVAARPLSDACRFAAGQLQYALDEGARKGPYSLLSALLEGGGEETGRRRIARRLGHGYVEAVDAFLDEALTFEEAEPRSIHGFLNRAERLQQSIKREVSSDEGGGVRVMTVHGAKGLEAPIVYLADADYLKAAFQHWRREPFVLADAAGMEEALPILVPSSGSADCEGTAALRADANERRIEEYQRLLYVAATRAEEHLVVCGGKESDEPSWHRLAADGFERLREDHEVSQRELPGGGEALRVERQGAMPEEPPAAAAPGPRTAAPDWLSRPAPEEKVAPVIYPSALVTEDEEPAATPVGVSGPDARRQGLLVHRLLEVLPDYPEGERGDVAARLADAFAPDLDAELRSSLAASALALIGAPHLAPVFGPGSRAEVSIQGEVDGTLVSGQIDRLRVTDDRIVVAEYKSTRWVPERREDIPARHVRQVEAYRGLLQKLYGDRPVTAVLIYTAAARAFEIA